MGAVFAQGAQWIRADFYLHSTDQQPNNLTIENIKAGNSNILICEIPS